MIKSALTQLFFILVCSPIFAQQTKAGFDIEGRVYEQNAQGVLMALPGAHIFCVEEQRGTISDTIGAFFLRTSSNKPISLIASFVGYESDTVEVKSADDVKMVLQVKTLLEVQLLDRRKSNAKSLLQVNNVEWISTEELHKGACCNLSESFETNPSVDVSFTDALTGAKQIQMLGLDGVYAQVLFENKPFLRGLSASYGLSFLPGTWIESIQVSKGTGSVVNGFESLSGQVNFELYKPQKSPKLLWNSYLNNMGLLENNFVVSPFLEGNWQTVLLGHYSYLGELVDNNQDRFVEDPKTNQLNLLNRWSYVGLKNRHITFGLRYLSEEKLGGQLGTVTVNPDRPDVNPYEIKLQTEQVEFHSKTAFIFDKPETSLGIIGTLRRHHQNTNFGYSHYNGEQQSAYLNLIYQSNLGDDSKVYKVGASYYGDHFKEQLQLNQPIESVFVRKDRTAGVFGEFQYKLGALFCGTLGARVDHSKEFGVWYSPRLHLRYNPIENGVLRASVGKAYRQANVFAENSSYFYSSRRLEMPDAGLAAEEAWNYGVNLTYNTYFYGKETTLNIDFYQTDFNEQVVVDLEESSRIKMYNLKGRSSSKSLQLDASIEPYAGWELKYAHKWNETKTTFASGVGYKAVPFTPKYRSMAQVSYAAWQNKWSVNVTVQNIGPSRVPADNTENHEKASYWSPKFQLISAQYTKRFKKVDWYLGVENLLNYLQKNSIRNFQEPYSEGFDAAMIWGPTQSRKLYTGIRLLIND